MTSPATIRAFRRDVHGLRGVAVALVVLDHAHFAATGGFVGVDVFFVISGFLITGHVLAELEERDRLDLVAFWGRRMRRILPAALLVALVTLVGGLVLMPPLLGPELVRTAVAVAAYVPNMLFAVEGTDYLAGTAPSPFQHFWSLGVEEQFYLLWPVVLLVAWRLGRTRGLLVAVVAAVGLSFALCIVVGGISQPWAFFSLPTRAWELAIGGVVAWLLRRGVAVPTKVAGVAGWAGLAAVVLAGVGFDTATTYPGPATLVPVLGTALLLLAGHTGPGWGPIVLLGTRPFTAVGTVSYSLYLWHWPLLVVPQALADGSELPVPARLAAIGAAVVLAVLTYRFVEEPARTASWRPLRGRWSTIGSGVVGSAVVVAIAFGSVPVLEARPATSDRVAPVVAPADPPPFTSYVPSNVVPSLRTAADDRSAIHRNGCYVAERDDTTVNDCVLGDPDGAVTVALVGDSHAGHWFPALERWAAERGDIRLLAYTKAGCPVVDVDVLSAGTLQTACAPWRAGVLRALAAEQPDVVVVSNSNNHDFAEPTGVLPRWTAATEELVRALPEASRVVVLANTPQFTTAPNECLSAHLDDADRCGLPRDAALDAEWITAEGRAVRSAAAAYVDLNGYLCDAERCGVVIGNVDLYRDRSHFTEQWSRAMWRQVGEAVDAAR